MDLTINGILLTTDGTTAKKEVVSTIETKFSIVLAESALMKGLLTITRPVATVDKKIEKITGGYE